MRKNEQQRQQNDDDNASRCCSGPSMLLGAITVLTVYVSRCSLLRLLLWIASLERNNESMCCKEIRFQRHDLQQCRTTDLRPSTPSSAWNLRSTTANSVRVTTDNFRTPLPCSCELSATRCCCLLRVSFSCYGVQCRTYSPRVAYRVVWRRLELNGFSQITCGAFILASVPSWSPTVYWRQSQLEKIRVDYPCPSDTK